jgi:hypothetical protein
MSRAAHDAIGDVLNLEEGCPFGNAASRLTRETANDKEAGAALAGAFAGVTAAGFDEDNAARALAAVAARRGARNTTSRAALDWLCLRLSYDELPKTFREDEVEEDRVKRNASQGSLEVISRGAPEPEKEEPPSLLGLMGLKEEPPKPPPPQIPDAPPPEAERAPRRKDSDEEALKQYALQAVLRQEAEAKAAEIRAREEEQRQREFDALPDDQKRDRLEATLRDLRQKHGALKKARAYDEMNSVGALAASIARCRGWFLFRFRGHSDHVGAVAACPRDSVDAMPHRTDLTEMLRAGEDIKRANDELRKLPERPKKVEELRRLW